MAASRVAQLAKLLDLVSRKGAERVGSQGESAGTQRVFF